MVIAGHSLYRLLWPDGACSGATPSLYTSWATPAALGFAEIEGELPTFPHGDFSKKCHTMVIADHVPHSRLWPVGARFGTTPSLCMSQEMPDVLGLLKLARKRLKYSTFMSIILQIRKFILNKPIGASPQTQFAIFVSMKSYYVTYVLCIILCILKHTHHHEVLPFCRFAILS
jgi:hypothetical protein